MLGQYGRGITKAVFNPVAKAFIKAGVTADAVTISGTVFASAAALTLIAPGHLVVGPLVVGLVVFTDSIDGIMARMTGSSSDWGAFLDSTLDRISDGAIFVSLVIFLAHQEGYDAELGFYAGLIATVLGGVVPYARARAEASGYRASMGIAERSDRLLIALTGSFIVGLGAPLWVLSAALCYLALVAAITIGQRMWAVRRQARTS